MQEFATGGPELRSSGSIDEIGVCSWWLGLSSWCSMSAGGKNVACIGIWQSEEVLGRVCSIDIKKHGVWSGGS